MAEQCIEYKKLVICIVGRGSKIELIKKDAMDRGLTNILFLDFMPKAEYMSFLSSCDVGLVSLNEKLQMPNIPSKTLTLFNMKKPIVASIDYSTDYGKFLENAKAGLWSYAGDIESFKKNVLTLYNDRELCKQMGENGYKFYNENMIPQKAYETIIQHIVNIK
jgi:glycosyltransferase involved in cell wall biosynthesis